jgi:hypothetical protein
MQADRVTGDILSFRELGSTAAWTLIHFSITILMPLNGYGAEIFVFCIAVFPVEHQVMCYDNAAAATPRRSLKSKVDREYGALLSDSHHCPRPTVGIVDRNLVRTVQ